MTAVAPSLLSLALLLTLAAPMHVQTEAAEHQPKRIYVGNLPFSAGSAEAEILVGVEEDEPAPTQIAFAADGRLGTPIQLSARETMHGGRGQVPAGREIRSLQIWTEAGTLTLRFPSPASNGWEEDVAAARYRYAPTEGEPVTGQATMEATIEDDVLGFTVEFTQARVMDETGSGR
ncbi:MAG: hypothetical protein AAF791_07870 [Bacteroidota bacterium]